MTEREKHYVIVPDYTVEPYLAKGYARSAQTAEQRLGPAWFELTHADRKDLVVVEIDAELHDQLNKNPRRFVANVEHDYYATSAKLRECDVLEDGLHFSVVSFDAAPEDVPTPRLFLTSQDAALSVVESVRTSIQNHQVAIINLERFLREHT